MKSDLLNDKKYSKFNIFNTILSVLLILTLLAFAFFEFYMLGSIILYILQACFIAPLIYIISYFEKKHDIISKRDYSFVLLINISSLICTITFGVLHFILWQARVIGFCIALLFVFEAFVRIGHFKREVIIWFQDILAMSVYLVITYSYIYPLIVSELSDTLLITVLGPTTLILLNGIIISGMFLLSFYLLYLHKSWRKEVKVFQFIVTLTFLTFLLFVMTFLNFWVYHFDFINFLNSLLVSIICFPTLLILFFLTNFSIKTFSKESFKVYLYYCAWIQVFTILGFIGLIFINNVEGQWFWIMLDVLFFFILLFFQFKLGSSLGKVSESTMRIFGALFSVVMIGEFIVLTFLLLSQILLIHLLPPLDNIILSSYFSLIATSLVAYLFSLKKKAQNVSKVLSFTSLLVLPVVSSWYIALLVLNSYFIFIVPALMFCLLAHFPILFLFRNEVSTTTTKTILFVNSVALWIFIVLIPLIVVLENFFAITIDVVNLMLVITSIALFYIKWLIKKIDLYENLQSLLSKCLSFIFYVFTGMVVFYYPYIFLQGPLFTILLPLILSSLYLFVPTSIAYKYKIFNQSWLKYFIFLNSLVLYFLVITIPIFIGLELNIRPTSVFIVTPTLVLVFSLLIFIEKVAKRVKISPKLVLNIKLVQAPTWFAISLIITSSYVYNVFAYNLQGFFFLGSILLIFFGLNIGTCFLINLFEKASSTAEEQELIYAKYKIINEIFKTIVYYGIMLSLAILTISLVEYIVSFNPIIAAESPVWIFSLEATAFIIVMFGYLKTTEKLIDRPYPKLNEWILLLSWLLLKSFLILTVVLFPSRELTFLNAPIAFFLFSILTPITIYHLDQANKLTQKSRNALKNAGHILFILSMIFFYIALFLLVTLQIDFFVNNIAILIFLLSSNLFLLSNLFLSRLKFLVESESLNDVYGIYFSFIGLWLCLLYIIPEVAMVLLLAGSLIIFAYRKNSIINKMLVYLSISLSSSLVILSLLDFKFLASGIPLGFYVIVFISCLIISVGISVLLNLSKNNTFDWLLFHGSCATWSLVYIMTYFPNILLLYNITISLFIFLLFVGITLYFLKDEKYRLFIRPSIILLVFDIFSYLSYRFFFINQAHGILNPLLTLTLTIIATDIAFVYLYRDLKDDARQRSFSIALGSLIIALPAFIGMFLISYSIITLEWPYALTIALNILIFSYFLSVGIYNWKFSRIIWETGWWAWNLLPIFNVFVIYQGVSGVDVLTNAIQVAGTQISGSIILTAIIFTLLYLPVIYTKIKKYFYECLLFVWGESIALIIWITLNIFLGEPLLITLSTVIVGIILLMPILYKLGRWRFVSFFWWILTIINASFITALLIANGVELAISISTGVIIGSLFFMIYSYFPNIKNKILYAVLSYIILISGIFSLISFVTYYIIFNPLISINIASIIIAFSLFTSKYLRFERMDPKRYIHLFISILLIWHFSWLTYNTFSLIQGLELFSVFLASAVLGGTLFVFNHYEMLIFKINKSIPWLIMAFGVSFAVLSLCFLVIPSLFLNLALFISVNIAFAFFWVGNYKYLLWYFFPIPLSLTIQEVLLLENIFQPLWMISLPITYILVFQIFVNSFNLLFRNRKSHRSFLKFYINQNRVKIHNFYCLTINSVLISMFLMLIVPFSLVNQIFTFLISFSLLMLFTLNYVNKSRVTMNIGGLRVEEHVKIFIAITWILLYVELTILALFLSIEQVGILIGMLISSCILVLCAFLDSSVVEQINSPIFNLVAFSLFYGIFPFASISLLLQYELFTLVSITLVVLLETIFIHYILYLVHQIGKGKKTKIIKNTGRSLIIFFTYLELSLLCFGSLMSFLAIIESILTSQIVLMVLVLIHLFVRKKEPLVKLYYLTFNITFFSISLTIFVLMALMVEINSIFISIGALVFVSMQLITNQILFVVRNKFNSGDRHNEKRAESITNSRNIMLRIIGTLIYILLNVCVIHGLILLNIDPPVIILIVSLINHSFMKLDRTILKLIGNIAGYLEVLFLGILIIFSLIFLVEVASIILLLNEVLIIFLIALISLIETFIFYYLYRLMCLIEKGVRLKNTKKAVGRFIVFITYLELSILFFGLLILSFGFFESLLVSHITLIIIIGIHVSFAKKGILAKYFYGTLIIAYFNVSLIIFILLAILSPINEIILNIAILIFLTMQLITNHAIYSVRNKFTSGEKQDEKRRESILKSKKIAQSFIGGLIYLWFNVCVVHALILVNIDWTLITLIVSLLIHGLMKLDRLEIKFLGKISGYFEASSWIILMIFSWIYLLGVFSTFLFDSVISVIPLAIFIFLLEITYFVYLLRFLKFFHSRMVKINRILILIYYANFITWPLYYSIPNAAIILNLFLASCAILFVITVIDTQIKAINEKLNMFLLRISFILIGVLVSVDLYVFLMEQVQPLISNFNPITNFALSSLLFLCFLGIVVLPLKLSHLQAFLFWMGISATSSLALLYGLFYNPSVVIENFALWGTLFLVFTCMFPFIFMWEELSAWVSKLIGIIIKKLRNMKLAILRFFKKIKSAFKHMYNAIVRFLKANFKYIFFIVNIVVFILIVYISITFLNLIWYHASLIGLLTVSILLYFISPARTSEDPIKQFRWKLLTYFAIWISVTALIAIYITYAPKINDLISLLTTSLVFLVSSVILGAIILIDIYRREKAGKISIKWRYYTTLFFVILLIVAIIVAAFLGINFVDAVAE